MNRITAFLTSAALLAAAPAFAQTSFSEWDEDGDGVLAQEEWDAGLAESGVFDSWDADDDGVVSAVEYEDGLFNWFDDDDDGALTVSEWDEWSELEVFLHRGPMRLRLLRSPCGRQPWPAVGSRLRSP